MITGLPVTIQSYIDNLQTNLFTALPATVEEFNSEEQTVLVKPVGLEADTDGLSREFPLIGDVPVVFTGAGGGSLTFPVTKGDEVLLVFSARNYDTWWDTGKVDSHPSTQRYHNLTDAVAIIGLTSKNNSVKASIEDVELKFEGNMYRQKADGTTEIETQSTLAISNTQEELITVLSDTLQAIADITSNTIYGISPINNKVDILALKARLDTFKRT